MKERIMVMENQEGSETQGEDWVVEAKKQVEDIRRNAQKSADVYPKVLAAIEHGQLWQKTHKKASDKYYDLGLKAFAKGNPEDAKRYAQDWEQFIQTHPEVANLSSSEQNTWLIKNNIPIKQGDALLTSREMANGIQMVEEEEQRRAQPPTTPAVEGPPAAGGEGQPPREPPQAPPSGPEDEKPEEGEEQRLPQRIKSKDPLEGWLIPIEIKEPGLPQFVYWPETDKGKLYRLGKIFNGLEQTTDPDGGPGFAARYRELEAIITSLLLSSKEEDRKVGQDMRREEKARLALHVAFLGYKDASDIAKVAAAVSSLTSEQLNWVFRQPAFRKALQYYETNGLSFVEATGDPTYPLTMTNFRMGVVNDLLNSGIVGQITDADIAKIVAEIKGPPEEVEKEARRLLAEKINADAKSIQTIAERVWQMTGRLAMHDQARQDEKGSWKFIGNGMAGEGGNFAMRKLLRFTDWLKTQEPGLKVFPELMKGIDIVARDWFEFATETLTGYVELTEKERNNIMSLPEEQRSAKEKELKEAKFFTSGKQNISDGVTRRTTHLDLTFVKWNELDFNKIGEKPMSFWSFRRLGQPEEAMLALSKDSNSLLRNPTGESLLALKDAFNYLTEKQLLWQLKENLLINTLGFMRKENVRKLKRPNISLEAEDKIIYDALQNNYIHKGQLRSIEEKILGWRKLPLRFSYFFNIIEFLIGLLSGVWNEVKKVVK